MANRNYQKEARIIKNIKVGRKYFKMSLDCADIAREAEPGQFVTIRVADEYEPLLRRPFSIHRVKGKNLEILYKVVGQGTEILSEKKKGQYLDVLGPLGNGFDYRGTNDPTTLKFRRAGERRGMILIAGGMGVAPLLFLAETMIKRLKVKGERLKVLVGARTKNQILCEDEFKKLGCEVKIATDDGSKGFPGTATDLLKNILPLAISHKPLAIYACGPKPMLKEIAALSRKFNIPAHGSLEAHMACGIGACMGCVVKTKDPTTLKLRRAGERRGTKDEFIYKRVCKDGPVFDLAVIRW
ncbi:MAG: dihydroorotate dehydrogenase electron transfer subunit [Candidatus Omnitrophota bacterium]